MKHLKTLSLAAALTASAAGMAHADWPTDRPIELIVAFAPGGGTDVMLRTLAPYLEAELDAQFPVLNRPGAAGEITYTALAQARPDGYTVSSLNTPGFLTMQIERKLRFEPSEICPIARIVEDPGLFVVPANSEFKSLTDLVAYAKEHPGAVSIGTTGVGTDEHLAMLQLERSAGVDLTAVPFTGSNDAKTALLGGHISAIGLNAGEYATADHNSMRAIGQFSEERSILAKDLPTAKEQGYDVIISSERGLAARCEVPEEIRARLADAVDKALANPEFQAQAAKQSVPLSFQSGADWQAAMPARLERYRSIFALMKEGQ
ncbi:tripartite tricarboxylate transporter substrate binding protein [Paracoccus laeviglucosivorans]|uniref:Tripartite-type tricarboxylate transporter, receptor component TctC n=1 Tax=Paracoccus laeviglucosivorans TaxID=1197861 RepID=A0A521EMY5_9RHOB|nr:tripartite tricarboxylate transporter substrate binding protein [Paracoccus laeviglucosivorans]SMO85295.1 Tripartite-type tricarboxylate transporter, receptor component TctC [Paracoccus laeviglucosivorans]